MVMTLILRVWLVIRAADRNLTPLRCCAGFTAALTAAPSFQPQNPRAHAPEAWPFPSRNLLFPRLENTSFLPQFGRPDFWFKFVRKGRESRDFLRSIATYDVKEPVLASKSSA